MKSEWIYYPMLWSGSKSRANDEGFGWDIDQILLGYVIGYNEYS